MEIERKFVLAKVPENISDYKHNEISQGYIGLDPVLRIRQKNDSYILTIKTGGLLSRFEFEKALTKDEFNELSSIVKGNIISKTRYIIPIENSDLKIELDVFHGDFDGLIYAEVEFPSIEASEKFVPPAYFSIEVTDDARYQNSSLSEMPKENIQAFIKETYSKIS